MKIKINYLIGIICSLFITSCVDDPRIINCSNAIDGWQISSLELPDNFYPHGMSFPLKETGYLVGEYGSIYRTDNAGDSWTLIHSGDLGNRVTTCNLSSVFFLDQNVGFVGGLKNYMPGKDYDLGAVFMKTNDGGQSWTTKYFKDFIDFNEIRFSNQNDGLAFVGLYDADKSWQKVLVTTNDGGNSWKVLTLPYKNLMSSSIIEFSSFIGVVCKDESNNEFLCRTNNGGKTWETKKLPPMWNTVYFVDDNIGFTSTETNGTFQTQDGGNTWAPATVLPFRTYSFIYFKNATQGFIINELYSYGGDGCFPDVSGYEANQTKDGGRTWLKNSYDKECDLTGSVREKGGDALYTIGYSSLDNKPILVRFESK